MSLKAREVLIMGQMPSYEERHSQMESILKHAVTNQFYGEQETASRCTYTHPLEAFEYSY